MKTAGQLIIIFALICLAAPLLGADTAADSPQKLYLQAGKEERSRSPEAARRIYESIITRYPDSDFAVKANDRLLALPPTTGKPDKTPEPSLVDYFTTRQPKPLPSDPLLRRGVELARLKAKAESVKRQELARQREFYQLKEGHRVNRSALAEKETQWQVAADRKVLDEFGMTLDEMGEKLRSLCKEAKATGECNEEAFQLLSTTP